MKTRNPKKILGFRSKRGLLERGFSGFHTDSCALYQVKENTLRPGLRTELKIVNFLFLFKLFQFFFIASGPV